MTYRKPVLTTMMWRSGSLPLLAWNLGALGVRNGLVELSGLCCEEMWGVADDLEAKWRWPTS